jgi:hypothetical protein
MCRFRDGFRDHTFLCTLAQFARKETHEKFLFAFGCAAEDLVQELCSRARRPAPLNPSQCGRRCHRAADQFDRWPPQPGHSARACENDRPSKADPTLRERAGQVGHGDVKFPQV